MPIISAVIRRLLCKKKKKPTMLLNGARRDVVGCFSKQHVQPMIRWHDVELTYSDALFIACLRRCIRRDHVARARDVFAVLAWSHRSLTWGSGEKEKFGYVTYRSGFPACLSRRRRKVSVLTTNKFSQLPKHHVHAGTDTLCMRMRRTTI